MIREDRKELNNRFRELFHLLEQRGKIVKNDRGGKGIGDLAEKILDKRSYGHIIKAFLDPNSPRVIDYHQAKKVCEHYNVNEAWLLEGQGEPFGITLHSFSDHLEAPSENKSNIVFTSINAFAGSAVSADSFVQEELEYFSIPGMGDNDYVSFPINGDSMEPVINDGDIVICEEVRNLDRIIDNDIYAVKINGSVWVKYVQTLKNKANRVNKLKLISANHLEHDPFVEEVDEYTKVYHVVKRICDI